MRHSIVLAIVAAGLVTTPALAAQKYHQGESVFVDGLENCIVQTGRADREGRYAVKCGAESYLIVPEGMRSNPDQTKTSRTFVCPGGGKPCYFKP